MAVRFVNNFSAALAAGVSSVDTELTFAAGVGDIFRTKLGSPLGTDYLYLTVYNSGGDVEYVKVTATASDDFTVVRGQDNSTARAWLSGDMVACRPNAGALRDAVSLPTDLARSGVNLDITELRGLRSLPTDLARSGVNLDITELRGMTVPLSEAQGGTGSATGAIPAGCVAHFAMNSAPAGWLAADGSAVSRTTYATLFAAIGTLYGAGVNSTTFNLPDLRGYFVRGAGANSDGTVAGTFGAKQAADIGPHKHPHVGGTFGETSAMSPRLFSTTNIATTAAIDDAYNAASTGTETRPRNIAMLACIKT
jgi:microcystin-dependent protein